MEGDEAPCSHAHLFVGGIRRECARFGDHDCREIASVAHAVPGVAQFHRLEGPEECARPQRGSVLAGSLRERFSRAGESPCSVETVTVANPEQAIVIIRGRELSYAVEYLRYLQGSKGDWQFAGENSAFKRNGPSNHEVMRVGGKPFLKTFQQSFAIWHQRLSGTRRLV